MSEPPIFDPSGGDVQIPDPFAMDFVALTHMVFKEISDDRTVAIICAAYVEKYLVDLIARHLPGLDGDPKLANTMFNETNGFVGTLATRLHLAMALNIISPQTYEDARLIGRIRNKFAHNVRVTSFDQVRGLIDNFHYGRDVIVKNGDGTTSKWGDGQSLGWRFRMVATNVCSQILHDHLSEHPVIKEIEAFRPNEPPPLPDKSDEAVSDDR